MANRLLAVLIFMGLAGTASGQAPAWQWVRSAHDAGNSITGDIAVDRWGNTVVVGRYEGECTIGTAVLPSHGNTDIFIASFAPGGQLNWAWHTGSNGDDIGMGIVVDSAGNVYASGTFKNTVAFGDSVFTSRGYEDIFLIKLSSAGAFQWAQHFGGPLRDRVSFALGGTSIDAASNCYLSGSFADGVTTAPYSYAIFGPVTLQATGNMSSFLLKVGKDGGVKWAKAFGGKFSSTAMGCTPDRHGNVFVVGIFSPPFAFFDTVKLTQRLTGSFGEMFVAKYDSAGNILWAKNAGGNGDGTGGASVVTDDHDNVYVTGKANCPITFFEDFSGMQFSGDEGFIVKYSPSGKVKWVKGLGISTNSAGYEILLDKNGKHLYVAGEFSGQGTFGQTTLTGQGIRDILILKVDTAGNNIWAMNAGGPGYDGVPQIALDPTGTDILVGGKYDGTAVFGPYTETSGGGSDGFIGRLAGATGIAAQSAGAQGLVVFPNPASGFLNIRTEYGGYDRLTVTDMTGRVVFRTALRPVPGSYAVPIPPHIAGGLYGAALSGPGKSECRTTFSIVR